MATSTILRQHDFVRLEYPYDDCRICQLPERNTRAHPPGDQLPLIPDHTEPARQLDLLPLG